MQVTADTKYIKQADGRFVPVDPKTDKPVPKAKYICGPVRYFADVNHDFRTYQPGELIELPIDDDDKNSWPSRDWEPWKDEHGNVDKVAAARIAYVRAEYEATQAEYQSAEAMKLAAERRAKLAMQNANDLKAKADLAREELRKLQGELQPTQAAAGDAKTMSELGRTEQNKRR